MGEDYDHNQDRLQGTKNKLIVEKSSLSGSLKLPPSKSHSMRWITLASMDSNPTQIEMWEVGEDVQALIDCFVKLGLLPELVV